MPLRRALLLQQMGIEQWVLHRPQALKGASAIAVAAHIKLVIVSDDPAPPTALLADLYRALGVSTEQCLLINHEQLQRLALSHSPALWRVGDAPTEQETPPTAVAQLPQITSLNWQQLRQSPQAKRQLWQQLQQFALQESQP
ncbi:DNA polymerase III subunit psi [Testudinibacter sp. P27/CKL/0425]